MEEEEEETGGGTLLLEELEEDEFLELQAAMERQSASAKEVLIKAFIGFFLSKARLKKYRK